MRFRLPPDMFYCFPKHSLPVFKDNTMPRIDASKYDAPAKDRVNVAKLRIQRARVVRLPASLRRQAE